MRKRFVLLTVLVLALLAAAAGCGGDDTSSDTTAAPGGATDTSAGTSDTQAGEPSSGETITLKYAFFAPGTTFPGVQMEKWKEEVEKRTNGRVKVETYPGGTLLTAPNMYDGVLNGVADIGLSCPTYEPGRFPLLSLSDLPGLYVNSRNASLSFYDLVQQFNPAELSEFHVITAFATEGAYIQTTDEVRTLADLDGMELRSAGGPKALEALGAVSVSLPMSEVGQALETGVISGYASSREVLLDFKFADSCKYVVDYRLGTTSFLALMSKEKWDSLPADVQKVMDDLGREMAEFAGSYLDTHVEEALAYAKEQGGTTVTLPADEKAKWDEALKPLEESTVADIAGKNLPAEEFLAAARDYAEKNQ